MRHTILLFEDDPTIRELVSQLLAEQGYEVLIARSLGDAEDMLDTSEVDLVLADSDGLGRTRAIESLRRLCGRAGRARILAFTAHRLTQDEARVMGCADVISKPFDVEDFLGRIAKHLE